MRRACPRDRCTYHQGRGGGPFSCEQMCSSAVIADGNAHPGDIQDATMKRCFGKDDKIIDCTWEYLSKQRTLREPHEPMPTLRELLEYMVNPGLEKTWLLLDIKVRCKTSERPRSVADKGDRSQTTRKISYGSSPKPSQKSLLLPIPLGTNVSCSAAGR